MNLSSRGVFLNPSPGSPAQTLALQVSMKVGTGLQIELDTGGQSLKTSAEVAWCSDFGIGVSFVTPPTALGDFLTTLVDDKPDHVSLRKLTKITFHLGS
jgi:hypothetical protein